MKGSVPEGFCGLRAVRWNRKKRGNALTDFSKEYRMKYDFHTHTVYSHGFPIPHGKGTVESNVAAAEKAGLEAIAIADHGFGHMFYGIRRGLVASERAEIEAAQAAHPSVRVYMSVEANIIEIGDNLDLTHEEAGQFDFLIAGFHYGAWNCHGVSNWLCDKHITTPRLRERLRDRNTAMIIGALRNYDIKILTHPGDKCPVDMAAIAKVCAETDTLMELNTSHLHLTVEELKIAAKEDVRFIIGSDAHTSDRVGDYVNGLERAEAAGVDFQRVVNIEKR